MEQPFLDSDVRSGESQLHIAILNIAQDCIIVDVVTFRIIRCTSDLRDTNAPVNNFAVMDIHMNRKVVYQFVNEHQEIIHFRFTARYSFAFAALATIFWWFLSTLFEPCVRLFRKWQQ